jgi:hypothetical protein
MQSGAKNAGQQVKVTSFSGFPLQISFKFWPSTAAAIRHFIPVPKF